MKNKALVTGCAGFIGSHLAEFLILHGWKVIGIDNFTDYYDRTIKEANLSALRTHPDFELIDGDLLEITPESYLKDIDYIFHNAGQPGVRGSWGKKFNLYVQNNILATQRLLEAAKDYPIKKFVYASSSSIYGNTDLFPMQENHLPQPFSPYGVTKLAGEQLCLLYYQNYRFPVVALRYFTVYGPRQRPEMAISAFIRAMKKNKAFTVYGDGSQLRDFTFIHDIVRANLLAAQSAVTGSVFNIGSGDPRSISDVISILEKEFAKIARINYQKTHVGDVKGTFADISKAQKILNYQPSISIERGLTYQIGENNLSYLTQNFHNSVSIE